MGSWTPSGRPREIRHGGGAAPGRGSRRPESGVEELPTLPVVVTRLLRLYASEEYSIDEVACALETDPSMSGRVLRLANSAYYGFSGEVERLHHALVLLGGVTVQSVALATTVLRRWARGAPPVHVREIWIHAYLCGSGCRYLGSRLPTADDLPLPDAFFLVGLFHDIGKILFLAQAPDSYAGLLESLAGEELRRAEEEHFHGDHAVTGGDLLAAWRLPVRVSSLVRHHHAGELRAELQRPLEVLRGVHRLLREDDSGGRFPGHTLSDALRSDVRDHLERARPGAKAFYEAIA